MITQILALIVAMTIVYFLSRLRYFILVRSKNKQKFYRTYIVGFDETDWDSDPDDNSNNQSDLQGTTVASKAAGNGLVEWPMELELRVQPTAHISKLSEESIQKAFTNIL